ncbi:MAG: DUF6807 family protein [Balneolales bacterium]
MKKKAGKSDITQGLVILLALGLTACGSKQIDQEEIFTVLSNDHDLINAPVYAELESGNYDENTVVCLNSETEIIPGQIETVSGTKHKLWWVVNQTAGESKTYTINRDEECSTVNFSWETVSDGATRLVLGDQPIIQYEHPVYDKDNVEETKKPFHHVYNPAGNELISNGPGGLYPHHRGIFFGFSQIYRDGSDEQINIWSSSNGERSEHVEIIKEFTGPVMGGHIVQIDWKDREGNSFIEETREIRVFQQPAGESLIDFHSTLKALDGPVRLEGDRQHAGVQFRAAQFVADHSEQTRFIRPAHLSHLQPDEEIGEEDMMNLPWNAMNFKIEDQPFTVAYLSHPSNPDAEMSERLYGRFGEYFPHYLTAEDPLTAGYRFWITTHEEPSANDIGLRHHAYVSSGI